MHHGEGEEVGGEAEGDSGSDRRRLK